MKINLYADTVADDVGIVTCEEEDICSRLCVRKTFKFYENESETGSYFFYEEISSGWAVYKMFYAEHFMKFFISFPV